MSEVKYEQYGQPIGSPMACGLSALPLINILNKSGPDKAETHVNTFFGTNFTLDVVQKISCCLSYTCKMDNMMHNM